MRIFLPVSIALFLLGFPLQVVSQDAGSALIRSKIDSSAVQNNELVNYGFSSPDKFKGVGNFLLSVYQEFFGVLISAECIYHPSCSRYSRESILKYGLIKGVLLSGDRLARCSQFAARDIPEFLYNEADYVEEKP